MTLIKKSLLAFLPILTLFLVSATVENPGYKVGDTVKDFSLKNTEGKVVSLKDYQQGKGVVVVFTCNTCPYAIAYEDRIINLHKKYADKGFPVLAINPNDIKKQPDDSIDKMKKRAKQKNFPFAYVQDITQETAKSFGASKTPHVYILKNTSDGMKVEYIGAIDDNSYKPEEVKRKYAENALDELIENKTVTETETKAIGCTIKWKDS